MMNSKPLRAHEDCRNSTPQPIIEFKSSSVKEAFFKDMKLTHKWWWGISVGFDEPVDMTFPNPLQNEFRIHHRFESCVRLFRLKCVPLFFLGPARGTGVRPGEPGQKEEQSGPGPPNGRWSRSLWSHRSQRWSRNGRIR